MSSISSVSSASTMAYSALNSGTRASQRPDPSKMVDNLFSKLDTSNQGYLTETDLSSAFSQLSTSTSSSSSTSASDIFKQLDSDSDGKVTKEEMTSSLKKLADQLDSQYDSLRTSGTTASAGTPPPPPPADGDQDAGLTKDQMTSMASNISSTDSTLASAMTNAANNFDAADTNEDGKVSFAETLAYAQKSQTSTSSSSTSATTASSSTSSTASVSSTSDEAKILKKLMDLMQAYGNFGDSYGQSSSSQNFTSLMGAISTSA